MKRFLSFFAAVTLFAAVLCGCSSEDMITDYPVTVGGCTLDKAPSKVAVLFRQAADAVCMMGGGLRLCGVPNGYLSEDAPAAASIGTVAAPDIERIKAVSPDVLITTSFTSDIALSELYDAGIKVVRLDAPYLQSELPEFYSSLGIVLSGNVSGKTAAENSYEILKSNVKAAAEEYSIPNEPMNAVFFSQGSYEFGDDTLIAELFSVCGLRIGKTPEIVVCDTSSESKAPEKYPSARIITVDLSANDLCGNGAVSAVKSLCSLIYGEK